MKRMIIGPRRALLVCALALAGLWVMTPVMAHDDKPHVGREKAEAAEVVVTPELAAAGKRIFSSYCRRCHHADSTRYKRGPGLKGIFSLETMPVTKHTVTVGNVREHIQKGGRNMPAFPQIKGKDMDALLAFLKSL